MTKPDYKHFLSLMDLSPESIDYMVNRSGYFANCASNYPKVLLEKVVGIYFPIPSTRTRTSFSVAAIRLGASIVSYGAKDLQLSTGETIKDTARILSNYLDAMVIRTNGSDQEMRDFASMDNLAIINAMSACEHPTQIIGDLATIKEQFGQLRGKHLLYLGEGNNTAAGLALGVAKMNGMSATFITPEGYGLSPVILRKAKELAEHYGAIIEQHHDADSLPKDVDIVYATRWQTMGVTHENDNWKDAFLPYQVSRDLMKKVSHSETIFLHDLPAVRGDDVTSEVLDGTQSLAWRQAEYKMYAAMAIIEWCLTANSKS